MSLAEQIAFFGKQGPCPVRALVGSHGANLVNMIWSPGPLAVVEVALDDGRHFSNYWHLASTLGFSHWLLPVPATSGTTAAVGVSGDILNPEIPERLWRTLLHALELDVPS